MIKEKAEKKKVISMLNAIVDFFSLIMAIVRWVILKLFH